jgi:hypothetical protein
VNRESELPSVTTEDDFDISQAVKHKGAAGVHYVVVDAMKNKTVDGTFTNWEIAFLQFRDSSGKFALSFSVVILVFTLSFCLHV